MIDDTLLDTMRHQRFRAVSAEMIAEMERRAIPGTVTGVCYRADGLLLTFILPEYNCSTAEVERYAI